jgi:hypothetical protein
VRSGGARAAGFAAALLIVFTSGCEDTTEPDDQDDQTPITERHLDPSTTGTGISNATGTHFVITPAGAARKQSLFVFLPGTGGRPDFYTTVLRHAAGRGHYAIGLAYPNAEAVNDLCATVPSPTCQEEVRIEVVTGAPRSSLVNVTVQNSIDNRLRALLTWLDASFPNEGWSSFLQNGEVRWDRVIVAGHSQGGGHAGMIARLRVVNRAVLFSSTEPAPWTATTFATPATRLFGFAHRGEAGYTGISASWRLMAMPGPVSSVDGATPPFGGSHQLQTGVATCRQVGPLDPEHNCVVTDQVTPVGVDGQPVFAQVWTYLLEG